MNELPTVSIIIPCRDENKYIGRCLDSIIESSYSKDRLKILIADGMSQDGTREILDSYARLYPFITVLNNVNKIIPCALNLCIAHAQGDLVIRMDAHAAYEKDYVAKCVKFMHL